MPFPDIGMNAGGAGTSTSGSGGFDLASSLLNLAPMIMSLFSGQGQQSGAGMQSLDPALRRMLEEQLSFERENQRMQQLRFQQQQPLFEAVTRGSLQRLPLSMRGILPSPTGAESSPLIGSFDTFESPGAPPTFIGQPPGSEPFIGEEAQEQQSIEDLLSGAPRRGGADSGTGKRTAANVAGVAAAPFTGGLSLMVPALSGLFGGAAETAPTDFYLADARGIIEEVIQTSQGRQPEPGEVDEYLRAQGLEPGDRWVGERGLQTILTTLQNTTDPAAAITQIRQLSGNA